MVYIQYLSAYKTTRNDVHEFSYNVLYFQPKLYNYMYHRTTYWIASTRGVDKFILPQCR